MASNFIELDETNKVIDKDVKKHINELKSKVKKSLPKTNIHELKVSITIRFKYIRVFLILI